MRNFQNMLKKTGAAVVAAAMIVTMGTGAVTAQAKNTLPTYTVSTASTYTDKQNSKNMEASVKIPQVTITGTNGKKMTAASKKLNLAISKYQKETIQNYKQDVAAIKEGTSGNETVSSTYKVIKNNRIFSLRIDTVLSMGSSHNTVKIFNIDKKTGKLLSLKNLFRTGSDYSTVLYDNIKSQMRAQMKKDSSVIYFIDSDSADDFSKITDTANFYINKNKELTIVFDDAEVAPSSMGTVEFSIPVNVISDIAVAGYLK